MLAMEAARASLAQVVMRIILANHLSGDLVASKAHGMAGLQTKGNAPPAWTI